MKLGVFFGLNMPKWLLKLGSIFIGTEPELILKSRRVYPENLLKTGFTFKTNNFDAFAV
jgi:NAD dependent epimerase/dehydratase family enzyme